MTQYGYEPLSPEDSGSTLLERVNGVVPALLTNHKGAARPGYVQPGMMWVDDSGATWLLNLFDGANDVPIAVVDPAKHALVTIHVPNTRKLRVGAGLSIDGVAGSEAHPAEGDLSADRLLNLVSLSLDTWKAGTDATEAPISPAQLAAAVAALGGGAVPKGVVELSASGNYTPSHGTKFILAILRGAGGSGAGANGSSNGGGGGGEGALGIALCPVSSATSYPAAIGAGGPYRTRGNDGIAGGATSITINGVTYSAGGGGGGTVSGSGGAGGGPSTSCVLGYMGGWGSLTTQGSSAWRQSGSYYGLGGGPSQAAGQSGSQNSGPGYDGHITILEFGA